MSDNPPAFPVIAENGLGHVSEGMSLRDWFAGQALVGYLSSNEYGPMTAAEVAAHCLAQADAMLAERAKP